MIIIDKRTGASIGGSIISSSKTFATHDPLELPYSAKHWWSVIELDTGMRIAISDDELEVLNKGNQNVTSSV